jgi:hypothetical protein
MAPKSISKVPLKVVEVSVPDNVTGAALISIPSLVNAMLASIVPASPLPVRRT